MADIPSGTLHRLQGTPGQPAGRAMRVERSGIVFSGRLSFETWETVGSRLTAFADSVSWWIADWLIYGESAFQDRYEEAIKRTSLNYKTLRNYTWVARRFDMSRRRDNLSFGHHAEVAALEQPEQDFWLRKAEEFGWSRNQLRTEVRSSQRDRREATDDAVGAADVGAPLQLSDGLQLRLTSDELAKCEATARHVGLTVDRWAAQVLVRAARGGSIAA